MYLYIVPGSEHQIDRIVMPMEMHLVHYKVVQIIIGTMTIIIIIFVVIVILKYQQENNPN